MTVNMYQETGVTEGTGCDRVTSRFVLRDVEPGERCALMLLTAGRC
jgi:hypothetical protein